MKKCHVDFRDVHHAMEAWSCVKKILNEFSVSPATSGLLMETMSDLAEAIDKYTKEEQKGEFIETWSKPISDDIA